MIIYSKEEGFITSNGIKFREGQDDKIILPEVAVGVYSHHLFEHIIKDYPEFEPKAVGYMETANFDRDVYILNYKGVKITFFIAGVGGPLIAGDIEELSKSGVKKFILFGNCGVLNKKIEDCSIIIPTRGYRDEGTSQHYIPDSEYIEMNPQYIFEFEEVLDSYNMDHTKGFTWTTDAIYRETEDKKEYFKSKGCICVEMEATTIAAVCCRKNLDYFTFFYAGDNLDAIQWERRSISGLDEFEKKKIIPFLALDLATKI